MSWWWSWFLTKELSRQSDIINIVKVIFWFWWCYLFWVDDGGHDAWQNNWQSNLDVVINDNPYDCDDNYWSNGEWWPFHLNPLWSPSCGKYRWSSWKHWKENVELKRDKFNTASPAVQEITLCGKFKFCSQIFSRMS